MRLATIYLLGFVVFGLVGSSIQAQDPVFHQFTTEDGLPSSMVYFSMQDSKGYIWSATDRGVTRFDGNRFELFTTKDGLPSNDVWGIEEDEEGRLWLNTFSKICYIENGKVKIWETDQLPSGTNLIQHEISPLGHFIFVTGEIGHMLFHKGDRLFKLNQEDYLHAFGSFILKENTHMLPIFKKARIQSKLSVRDSLIIVGKTIIIDRASAIKDKFLSKRISPKLECCLSFSSSRLLFLIDGALWLMDNTGFSPIDLSKIWKDQTHSRILKMQRYGTDKIWLRTENKDYVLDTLWRALPGFDYLSNLAINQLTTDKQGNLWLSTDHGLYFLNLKNQRSKTYTANRKGTSGSINFLALDDQHKVWALGAEGHLYYLNEEKGLQTKSLNLITRDAKDLKFDLAGNLWVGGKFLRKISRKRMEADRLIQGFQDMELTPNLNSIKKLHFDMKGNAMMSTATGIYQLNTLKNEISKNLHQGRFYGITQKENGKYWIAGKNSLKLISKEGVDLAIPNKEQYPVFDLPTNDIVVGKNKNLWLAVENRGVFQFDGVHLDSIIELDNVIVQSLYVDAKQRLWVCTNQGLAKLDIAETRPLVYEFQWFRTADGLVSNNVKEVIVANNKIYVATEKGVTVLPDAEEEEVLEMDPFYFSNVQINGKDTLVQESYNLKPTQNNLLIEYQCLDYKNMGSMVFQYQMEGVDQDWIETQSFYKEYPLLPPGDYTFRVKRKTEAALTDQLSLVIQFTIHPPWWKRGWFIASFLLGLGALVYFLLRRRIQQVKKQAGEENALHRKFAELELNALQAQMNPHFVFNALHAIQDFIFKKDERVANRYIVKFSRLMRLFLESSKEKYIVLEDEIQLLKLYIELEHLRFEDKFTFEIKVAENLAPSMIEVPAMLLQPFVENAINHGLIHLKEPGKLLITFEKKEAHLHCRIEDNGIGRKKAMEIKEQSINSYKSRGMQLVEERQRVWNIIGNTQVEISIEDLYGRDGVAIGTRVDLIINVGT